MYHPTKYEEHNKALKNLIDKFNKTANRLGGLVEMYFQEHENYRDDGGVIYKQTNEKFLYDFEKRHQYYASCQDFVYRSLGQFERKIKKEEIRLSIQCSSDEKCLMLAWHNDYQKEKAEKIKSSTEDGKGETNPKRFTTDFIEISYNDMDILYDIFLSAFQQKTFDKCTFNLITTPKKKYENTPIYYVECNDLIELATNKDDTYKKIAKQELQRRCCK